jgi:hypothetical protein
MVHKECHVIRFCEVLVHPILVMNTSWLMHLCETEDAGGTEDCIRSINGNHTSLSL